jgi:hypothetical protein
MMMLDRKISLVCEGLTSYYWISIKTENLGLNIENIAKQDNNKQPIPSPEPSSDTTTTITSQNIYRVHRHSDTWACKICKLRGDIHFMKQHIYRSHVSMTSAKKNLK